MTRSLQITQKPQALHLDVGQGRKDAELLDFVGPVICGVWLVLKASYNTKRRESCDPSLF